MLPRTGSAHRLAAATAALSDSRALRMAHTCSEHGALLGALLGIAQACFLNCA